MTPAPLWGKDWPGWARRLQRAPALALFSDFDGTLAPIASRPQRARLPATTRDLLRKLSRQPHLFLALVSGRPVAELRRMARLSRAAYIGIHGIEVAWPGQKITSLASEKDRARVEQARQKLETALQETPGIWVERKPASVAVHFRKAPPEVEPAIQRAVQAVAQGYRGQLVLQAGKKVLELLPAIGASKASAVSALLEKLPTWLGRAPFPLYLGDDRTDETVFRKLKTRGLTILVGRPGEGSSESPSTSEARYYLEDPTEVRKFLRELLSLRRAAG